MATLVRDPLYSSQRARRWPGEALLSEALGVTLLLHPPPPAGLPPGEQMLLLPLGQRRAHQEVSYSRRIGLLLPPAAQPPGEQATALPQRGRARLPDGAYQSPLALLAPPPIIVPLPPGRTMTDVPRRAQTGVYQAWTQDLLSTQQPPSFSIIEYIYFARRRMRK